MVNKIFEFEILFLSQKFELENPLDFQLQVVLLNVKSSLGPYENLLKTILSVNQTFDFEILWFRIKFEFWNPSGFIQI